MGLDERLYQLRKQKGLTQADVAEKLGISRQAVSRWEIGAAIPTLENIKILSELFGVSVEYLLGGDSGVEEAEYTEDKAIQNDTNPSSEGTEEIPISSCLEDLPQENGKPGQRLAIYGSRVRMLMRVLVIILLVAVAVVVIWQGIQRINSSKESKWLSEMEFDDSGPSSFGDDFQFWPSAEETQSAQYLMWFYKREVDRYGVDNVALLTPFRKKSKTGVYSLNAALHDTINPASPEKDEIETGQRILRVGDKVMQMKNRDFASNGDIGYICTSKRDSDGILVEVDFGDDRVVAYEDAESLRQVELAYAATIHKSQGSEYDAVLINIQNMHGKMLNRALIYTAETRAKKQVIIVGDWEAVVRAIQTADTKRRNTMLAVRINDLTKE